MFWSGAFFVAVILKYDRGNLLFSLGLKRKQENRPHASQNKKLNIFKKGIVKRFQLSYNFNKSI